MTPLQLKLKEIKPIKGFKVMEWLRNVREKEADLYKNDPEEYFKQLKIANKKMQARIKAALKKEKELA
jgi:hypothetical protein